MFIDFQIIDKKDIKPLSSLLEKIDRKIADVSNLESNNIRLGMNTKVNYDLYEHLTFYRDVLIESFCGSSCIPYSSNVIVSKINSLLNKNC